MSNSNLKGIINNATVHQSQQEFTQNPLQNNSLTEKYESVQQMEYLSKSTGTYPQQNNKNKQKRRTKADKILKKAGLVFFGLSIVSMIVAINLDTSSNVDISNASEEALEHHVSTELAVGTRLLQTDENMTGQDYTIAHSSTENSTKLYIWDYAAEDGDYVQVLVDGTPLGDPFMVKNKPIKYTIPSIGEVQVFGTRDGGGGITYAVHYDVNGTTYFNGTDVGSGNLYTLIRE